jgi:hypothetical protein
LRGQGLIHRLRGYNQRRIARLAVAGLVAILTFLTLTPAWWSDPLGMPARVLDQRDGLLEGQVAKYGGYDGAGERIGGLIDNAFFARPQYYEDPAWKDYIPAEIAAYDGQWFAGRGGGPIWGALLIVAVAVGLVALRRRWRDGPVWVLLIWAGVTALGLLIATPLDWQRYYLPLQPPLAIIAGIGTWRAAHPVIARARQGTR